MATTNLDEIAGWFAGRLPDGWFAGAPSVTLDGEQIVVVGTLGSELSLPEGASEEYRRAAEAGRISRFREATRAYRIAIAREAEHKFERPVTWGATSGATTLTFTPGGSGRRKAEEAETPKQVMIAARARALRAWRRRFAFGPRAWRWGPWGPWAGPREPRWPGSDVQRF